MEANGKIRLLLIQQFKKATQKLRTKLGTLGCSIIDYDCTCRFDCYARESWFV